MSVAPKGLSIQSLYRDYRDGSLVINRQYQRKLVWTVAEKQKLIESVLLNYPIPLILLAEKKVDGKGVIEVIDGMQRLNAIFSFIEHALLFLESALISTSLRVLAKPKKRDFLTSLVQALSDLQQLFVQIS
ncbi:DUF262 domain-containing protein [Rhizobium sp. CNPSo 4062]|uniref:DUF262 domain-containing protein n=1 Tax=Rhizobium sp. CNPSo 4062 TaxID=3021410 RepID=UPI00254C6EEF|nr:DUF262 domain-containing protein [Rhizobium sp. CNPSo 4062]MDK4705382.1 DUF262 domain-containing protein [Rhizobium sp. CNPSo 4062]